MNYFTTDNQQLSKPLTISCLLNRPVSEHTKKCREKKNARKFEFRIRSNVRPSRTDMTF